MTRNDQKEVMFEALLVENKDRDPHFFVLSQQQHLNFKISMKKVAITRFLKNDQGVTDSLIRYIKDTAKTKYKTRLMKEKTKLIHSCCLAKFLY